jgi:hypothetical protein
MSGKEILIGVYNDTMIFPTLPSGMPHLVIRTALDVLDKSAKKLMMYLKDPAGTTLGTFNCDLSTVKFDGHLVLGFGIQPLIFNSAGTYTIHLGVDDDPPDQISDFQVRLPQDESERSRIPQTSS